MTLTIDTHQTGLTAWEMIKGKDCQISLEPRPHYCDRGNWIAKLHVLNPAPQLGGGGLWIDEADGWPRYYFDHTRALAEIEAWLVKREQMP